jgi:Flp pilus assembly pilin Flp
MRASFPFREQAVFLRESSGSTNIETTLLKALKVLKLFDTSVESEITY